MASLLTGYSVQAMEAKIKRGDWLEGHEYVRRDGRIHVDIEGYKRWVEGKRR